MTKTETDARRAVPPAFTAALALTAMLFASRLPVTLDFILPRRAGWPLFALGFELLSRPGPRRFFTTGVTLLMLGALGRFIWLVSAAVRGRKWSLREFLGRGFAVALVLLLMHWSFSIWFEISQKVWFPLGSLNVLEPYANLLVFFLILFCAMSVALAFLSPRPPPIFAAFLSWAAANAFAAVAAAAVYGAWSAPVVPEAGRRLFVVLTEEAGRPGQSAYDLPVSPAQELAKGGVRRLESLRASYESNAKLMDPAGLRQALMRGVKDNDDLARSLLLESLSSAPPSPEALGALGALADETAHRIGPMGASRIALAYAHLGDAAQAALWAKRGEQGPRGIPAGLLDLKGGGALKPGRISGRLEGRTPLKIGLYRKANPAAPYLLDAAGLAASTEPDAKGRFSFSGLTAGRYYLAFAFEVPDGAIRVAGHRGDLKLDARRSTLDLPPLKAVVSTLK
ncbi:MAG: hypothetical protein COV48_00460 [Elusimicrobia bacterium CG11_big_fil_rev_8_21_14_0_20_64_6]|nr:MAG: hypothetical protein COV48_00460 [Elusimicrobia bacterium CG11_big_fil_rev_8_21_14_0_20_64_6]